MLTLVVGVFGFSPHALADDGGGDSSSDSSDASGQGVSTADVAGDAVKGGAYDPADR